MPSRRTFLQRLDTARIEAAIARAEEGTSGEIRVCVAPWFWGDVQRNAERAFVRLGMHETRERNAVLLFVVPARRKFTIFGDVGIHAKVGTTLWPEVQATLARAFAGGAYSDGIVSAVELVGRRLAEHFPASPTDNPNELPDRVE